MRFPTPLRRLQLVVALPLLAAACSTNVSSPLPTPTPTYPAPALVQIENSPGAHPQWGLQKADIVFEYVAEGGVSRFTAIYFHPSGSFRVEPVRSTRLITIRLQKAYRGLIVTSGASNYVLGLLYRENIPFIDEDTGGGRFFHRDQNQGNPSAGIFHNLYSTGAQMADAINRRHMRITYQLPAPAEPTTKGTAATRISFNQTPSHGVRYVYSASRKAYEYFWSYNGNDGGATVDGNDGNAPVMISNAVIVFVPHHGMHYHEDYLGEEGQDVVLQGTGQAVVFTRGQRFDATWDMTNQTQPLKILGKDGKPFPLAAGLTWINLVDPGTPLTVS